MEKVDSMRIPVMHASTIGCNATAEEIQIIDKRITAWIQPYKHLLEKYKNKIS